MFLIIKIHITSKYASEETEHEFWMKKSHMNSEHKMWLNS